MTISMHEASVGFFVPFLRNLSRLLDHAARHAEARKIDPSVLLKMRLFPNMYDFAQQVGEVSRHAVVACALLARLLQMRCRGPCHQVEKRGESAASWYVGWFEPSGRKRKATPKVAKDATVAADAPSPGKNTLPKTSAAAVP